MSSLGNFTSKELTKNQKATSPIVRDVPPGHLGRSGRFPLLSSVWEAVRGDLESFPKVSRSGQVTHYHVRSAPAVFHLDARWNVGVSQRLGKSEGHSIKVIDPLCPTWCKYPHLIRTCSEPPDGDESLRQHTSWSLSSTSLATRSITLCKS